MENLKIATWNIENNKSKTKKDLYKINAIFDLLQVERVDIIALQNVNLLLAENLEYNFFRKSSIYNLIYNYTNLKNVFYFKKYKIETNPFITSYKEAFGYGMEINPSFKDDQKYIGRLSIQPFFDGISFLNTRLVDSDIDLNKAQIKEVLKKTYEAEKIYTDLNYHKLFVCGDFGYTKDNDNIKYLIENMKKFNLKLVNTDEDVTDYLFVPNGCFIEEAHFSKAYSDISSHYPIIAKIKI